MANNYLSTLNFCCGEKVPEKLISWPHVLLLIPEMDVLLAAFNFLCCKNELMDWFKVGLKNIQIDAS